jgi:hypothetical protein
MAFPSGTLLSEMRGRVRDEFDSYYAQLAAWLGVEHHPNGRHKGPTVVPYTEIDFKAQSGAWTVDARDYINHAYRIQGDVMTVWFEFDTTNVSATPTYLAIPVPAGRIAARRASSAIEITDAGTSGGGWHA